MFWTNFEQKFDCETTVSISGHNFVHLQVIFDGSDCAPMAAEEYRVFNGTRAMAIADENGAFLRFLSSQSGFAQSPLPLREMRYVFDPINCRVNKQYKWI